MINFNSRFKKYFILGIVGVVVGLLYTLYHLFLIKWYGEIGETHLSVAPLFDGYASTIWERLRELLDGHWRLSDVSNFEYLGGPTTLFPLLTPLLYWPLVKIAGLYGVMPLGNFVFGFIIFLLLYKLSYLLTEKFSLSMVFSGIFVMIRDLPFLLLPSSISGFKDLVKVFLPWTVNVNSINRLNFLAMESIKPGFLILGSFLIFLLLFLKTEKRKFAILSGIFYGLLFYTYTFFWIYGTIVMGLVCLLYLF